MENSDLWKEALNRSIPLINYIILSGATNQMVSKVLGEIEAEDDDIFPSTELPEITPSII